MVDLVGVFSRLFFAELFNLLYFQFGEFCCEDDAEDDEIIWLAVSFVSFLIERDFIDVFIGLIELTFLGLSMLELLLSFFL